MTDPGTSMRQAYRRELAEVESSLELIGALAAECIPRGTEILLSGELDEAQALIDDDDEIDRLAVNLEERCYSIMVRQAPMAGELRQLIATAQITGELERAADLMSNIAKGARRMYGSPMTPRLRGLFASMADESQRMVKLSMEAYSGRDEALAAALNDIDDRLDDLNREVIEAIFEAHDQGQITLQASVQLALIGRYYERIGDHAVNIGNRVSYMITGWMPEHVGAMRAETARNKAS